MGGARFGIASGSLENTAKHVLKRIKERGGLAIVQDPKTAKDASMPREAIAATKVDLILPLDQIGPFLVKIAHEKKAREVN